LFSPGLLIRLLPAQATRREPKHCRQGIPDCPRDLAGMTLPLFRRKFRAKKCDVDNWPESGLQKTRFEQIAVYESGVLGTRFRDFRVRESGL
jgi:hypothetical protein